jgi:hypothetical protein
LTWDFLGINILSQEASRDREVNEKGHEAQMSTGGMGPMPGRTTLPCLVLGPPMSSIFISDWSAWPKNAYIKAS